MIRNQTAKQTMRKDHVMDKNQSHGNVRLLLSNVPPNCRDEYVRRWVEARGYRVSSVRVIRDVVSGTSPSFAYVQLMNSGKLDEAVRALNGQTLEGRTIQAARVTPLSSSA